MKYVIAKYLRISTEDIDLDGLNKYESNSIGNQRAYLNDFIKRTPEFENCEIIEMLDDGLTGTNFQRPGVQKLIAMAQSGKVNCILVKDLSRWGRNYLEVGDFLEQKFPLWGVRFISLNDMYDSATLNGTTGGIDIAFRNLVYEIYSRDLSEKVRSANRSAVKMGKVIRISAYGYQKDTSDNRKVTIDEIAASIVRQIFDLTESGFSPWDIAKKLTADGIASPKVRKRELGSNMKWNKTDSVFWNESTVRHILKDEQYTGKLIFGKSECVEVGQNNVKSVPREDWVIVPGAIPTIITEEQFQRVQKILASKSIPGYGGASKLVLSKKLKCGHCGHALTKSYGSKEHIFYCSVRKVNGNPNCTWSLDKGRKGLKASALYAAVLDALKVQIELAVERKELQKTNAKSAMPTISNLRSDIQTI